MIPDNDNESFDMRGEKSWKVEKVMLLAGLALLLYAGTASL